MNLTTLITNDKLAFVNESNENLAEVTYTVNDDILVILKVEVNPILQGQGIASKLMKEFYDYAKNKQMKIKPICSYAVNWFSKNEEKKDLLVNE